MTSLSQLLLCSCFSALMTWTCAGAEEAVMPEVRGIYINAHQAGGARAMVLADSLVAAGGNAIVFDVKDRLGRLSYVSQVPLAQQIGASDHATIKHPAALVRSWHERGIYVVARLTCFYDVQLVEARPDLVPLSRKGDGLWSERGVPSWVDPALPEVQQYLLDLVLEVAELGVDEIQLDYVRFPTEGDLNDAVFSFDPEKLPKDKVITEFVRRVHETLAPTGVRLSADIFGVIAWGRQADIKNIGQNAVDLLAWLDVVSPMLYPSHFEDGFDRIPSPVDYPYYFLLQGCRRLRELAQQHGVEVRPWVQAFDYRVRDFDVEYITEQLHGAEDGGAHGWLLWNPASRYSIGLEAIARFVDGTTTVPEAHERLPAPLGALLPTQPLVD